MKQKLETLLEELEGAFHSLDEMYSTDEIKSLHDEFEDTKQGLCGTIDETMQTMKDILKRTKEIDDEFWAGVEPLPERDFAPYGDTWAQV